MTLPDGKRLGPYEIVAALGAGGMGEVYRAKDSRLHRDVAIKVLPERFAETPESRERFEREARTVSQLSHPNVCAIYDVGREGGVEYLVMELLEGETLTDRLGRGPLPLETALRIGAQVAAALDAAHRKGIVHRDLKPGNVMLTASGVKLLDFGLARGFADSAAPGDLTAAATMGRDLTAEGSIVGTVPYMAPEQLEGRPADARTDVFALGSVLYEMVTGRKAFTGASQASLISAILTTEPPPISVSQPMSPPALDRLVRTCLAKDPNERWQSAHDVELQLRGISETLSSSSAVGAAAAVPRRRRARAWLPWAIAALAAVAGGLVWLRRPPSAAPEPIRFHVLPPEDGAFGSWGEGVTLDLSPDGRRLAFTGYGREGPGHVYVRSLAEVEARMVEGTEGANSVFWSPDGDSIAFFTPQRLARVSLKGGAPVTICDLPGGIGRSGTWSREGQILFSDVQGDAIYRVAADGGTPEPVVRSDPGKGNFRVIWPWYLPDGKSFLYLAWRGDRKDTLMLERPGRPPTPVLPLLSRAEYVEPGYLVYARDGALFAQRFDAEAAKTSGPPIPIAPAVDYFLSTNWAAFSARPGALAYRSSRPVDRMTWYDRTGRVVGTAGEPARYLDLAISPDGRSVLFSKARQDVGTWDVWRFDVARGVATPVTNSIESEFAAIWLKDGKSIVYSKRIGPAPQIFMLNLETGEERQLAPSRGFQRAMSISADGRTLSFDERKAGGSFQAWTLPLDGGRPAPFGSPAPSAPPALSARDQNTVISSSRELRYSPDGRVVALFGADTGRPELYVAPVGSPAARVRVSTQGAADMQFSRDGSELFYLSLDDQMMAVPIRSSPSIDAGEPRALFRVDPSKPWIGFDVAPDGRFLAIVEEVSGRRQPATVAVNWTPELK